MSGTKRLLDAVDPYLDDFEEVLRVLELSSGFVLLPIAVPGPDLARLLASWLSRGAHPALVHAPDGNDEWKNLASWLLNAKPEKNGVVMVIAGGDAPEDLSLALRLLNERRDAIAKHLNCPLLWCGAPAFLVQTGQQAPDFWSVRAVERRIEAQTKLTRPKMTPKKESAKVELLEEAIRQGDRQSTQILSMAHLRKAMADGDDERFDALVASAPEALLQADPKLKIDLGLLKAEMARRRGRIADALKTLDALEDIVDTPDDEGRIDLLRGRIWQKAGDTAQAEKAFARARAKPTSSRSGLQIHADLYNYASIEKSASFGETHLDHVCREAEATAKDRPLQALGAALLAQATARQHDQRRARRILHKAIALHEQSKDDATVLFPGEVAEAIQNAHDTIAKSSKSIANSQVVAPSTARVIPLALLIPLVALVALVALIIGWLLGASSIDVYCFQTSDGKIKTTCTTSLERCEKRRAAARETSSPCQKPLFIPPP